MNPLRSIHKPLLSLVALLLLAACNKETPKEPISEYQKENEAYFDNLKNNREYQPLLFLNEHYPIYYKVIEKAPDKNQHLHPVLNSTVSFFVGGKLTNGQVFERRSTVPTSSVIQGTPTNSGGLIKGVQIALQNMSPGDRWEVVIPWQLGYGPYLSGGGSIPGFSTLIFDLELVEIIKM